MALFGVAVAVAVFYSGMVLRLMDPTDVVGGFIATVLLSVPILYFVGSHLMLTRLSARAVSKHGNA
jgi:ABC-type multidrug transport system permease subunit